MIDRLIQWLSFVVVWVSVHYLKRLLPALRRSLVPSFRNVSHAVGVWCARVWRAWKAEEPEPADAIAALWASCSLFVLASLGWCYWCWCVPVIRHSGLTLHACWIGAAAFIEFMLCGTFFVYGALLLKSKQTKRLPKNNGNGWFGGRN